MYHSLTPVCTIPLTHLDFNHEGGNCNKQTNNDISGLNLLHQLNAQYYIYVNFDDVSPTCYGISVSYHLQGVRYSTFTTKHQ